MIQNPFARIGLGFAATLFVLNLNPELTVVAAASAAVCLGICLLARGRNDRGGAALLLLSVMAAAVLFAAAQKTVWEPALAMDRQTVSLRGEATGEAYGSEDHSFTVVRTEQGQKVTLVTKENLDLKPGDRVSFYGKLYADQPWLSRAGRVFLTCWYPKELTVQRLEKARVRDWPYVARCFLIERITQRVGGQPGAAAAAMVTGEKEGLSDETYGAFKSAGISHVIAVSGLHMNLLMLALFQLLRRGLHMKRRPCAAVCIAAAWIYAAVADFTPSAVRACLMLSAFLGGVLFHRRVSPLNSLGLAAALILLFNPYAVCSASFELSFAATLALVTIGRRLLAMDPFARVRLTPLRKILTAVYAALAVTFSANIGCLPVFLFLGIDATFACFVSNLATFFAVAPALITGLLTALPGVFGRLSARLCRLCVGYILFVVRKVSAVKWLSLFSVEAAGILAAVVLLGFLISVCRKKIKEKRSKPVTTKE